MAGEAAADEDRDATIITARQDDNLRWVGIVRRGGVSRECEHTHAYEGFARECADRMATAGKPTVQP